VVVWSRGISLLRPDPTRRARLVDIHDNLNARIAEAEREGWFGELEGLHVSLAGAKEKLAQIQNGPSPSACRTSGRGAAMGLRATRNRQGITSQVALVLRL
jgi:hypothetical protein